jgi:hypothetical protein
VQYVVSLLFAPLCYLLITGLVFNILSTFIFLFCVYFLFYVFCGFVTFCVLLLLLYIAVYLLVFFTSLPTAATGWKHN